MKLIRKVGVTSEIWQVFIRDSSSTTGAGLTGLTNASGSLTAYYHRDTDTTATAISLVTMTVGTFTSSGFKEIDATNMPGWYQFCPPNAALASGAKSCAFHLKGATNMAPLPIEAQLISIDLDDAVHGGMSSLPNTACTTNASLLTSGTGTDQLSVSAGKVLLQATQSGVTIPTVTTVTNQLTAAAIATGVWQDSTAGDFTTALSIGKSIMNGVTLGTGLTINAYTGNTPQTGDSFARLTGTGAVTFASLTVSGATTLTGNVSMVAGLTVTQSTLNGAAISCTGNGSGPGIISTGGLTGAGILGVGGATSGDGIQGVAFGNSNGFHGTGSGSGDGLAVTGGTTGRGIHAVGGGSSGAGIRSEGTAGNANGVEFIHQGSGLDLSATTTNLTLAKTTNLTGFNDVSTSDVQTACDAAVTANTLVIEIGADADELITSVTAIPTTPLLAANVPTHFSSMAITASGAVAVDGTSALTESYSTNGGAMTLAQALYEIAQNVGEFAIANTLITVKKRDHSTTAETYTLDDGTNPTSRTRAS